MQNYTKSSVSFLLSYSFQSLQRQIFVQVLTQSQSHLKKRRKKTNSLTKIPIWSCWRSSHAIVENLNSFFFFHRQKFMWHQCLFSVFLPEKSLVWWLIVWGTVTATVTAGVLTDMEVDMVVTIEEDTEATDLTKPSIGFLRATIKVPSPSTAIFVQSTLSPSTPF